MTEMGSHLTSERKNLSSRPVLGFVDTQGRKGVISPQREPAVWEAGGSLEQGVVEGSPLEECVCVCVTLCLPVCPRVCATP